MTLKSFFDLIGGKTTLTVTLPFFTLKHINNAFQTYLSIIIVSIQ